MKLVVVDNVEPTSPSTYVTYTQNNYTKKKVILVKTLPNITRSVKENERNSPRFRPHSSGGATIYTGK